MNVRSLTIYCTLLMAGLVGIPLTSEAGPVFLQIENEPLLTNPAPGSFNGIKTCSVDNTKTYQIQGNGTLTASDGAGPDSISFNNLTIKATTAGACGRISFWTTVTPPPGGNGKLDAVANGNMRRPSNYNKGAVGSFICVTGWSQIPGGTGSWDLLGGAINSCQQLNPPQPETFYKLVTLATATGGQFTLTTTSPLQTEAIVIGANATTLKGEIKFFLHDVNDELVITTGNGIKVMTAAGGGGGGVDPRDLTFGDVLDRIEMSEARIRWMEQHLKIPPFPGPRRTPDPLPEPLLEEEFGKK